jgi:hypothetical protein
MQLTGSRFFNDWLGLRIEGDYLSTNASNLRDAGVRIGPVARFRTSRVVHPYVHALVGYSEVKASYLNPSTSFNGAPSLLSGAGLDVPLSRSWYGRVEGDLEYDWTAVHPTRTVRGLVGVAYRFGAR